MPASTLGPVVISPLGGDGLLTYKSGGGFLPAPNNVLPAAFKSLHHLTSWWLDNGGAVFSINSVSSNVAICVLPNYAEVRASDTAYDTLQRISGKKVNLAALSGGWVLYTAPSAANHASHYLISYLKATPGATTGPAVSGLKIAKYVIISNNPSLGTANNWWFNCTPNTNKFTQLTS
jgi:hypothetical protein